LEDYFDIWITKWKESKNEDIFYYSLNNGLIGIIFKNTNIQLVLDESSHKFYEIIKNGEKEDISVHSLYDYPDNLKQSVEKLLNYYKDPTNKINNFNSQGLFSEINTENINNKISNELSESSNLEESNSSELTSGEIKNPELIYVKKLIIENKKHINIYLLILNDGTYHVIFEEIKKNIIEIIISYKKNIIGYIDNKYNYKNIIKLENWRVNPNKNFVKRILLQKKLEASKIIKELKKKRSNNSSKNI
jgi:hypothetical protein